MRIEILSVSNCPNHTVAVERLREILSSEEFEKFVSEILVGDAETAELLRFPGSPTVRINGQDVEPQSGNATSFGLMCRLYSDGKSAPSVRRLCAAVEKARGFGD